MIYAVLYEEGTRLVADRRADAAQARYARARRPPHRRVPRAGGVLSTVQVTLTAAAAVPVSTRRPRTRRAHESG